VTKVNAQVLSFPETFEQDLSADQQANLALLLESGVYSSVERVSVNASSLDISKQTGEIELDLDDKLGCTPTILLSSYNRLENGDDFFKGNVLSKYDADGEPLCECVEGEVSFYQTNSTFSGVIYVDERTFELRDVGENVHFLAERSANQVANQCGLHTDEEENGHFTVCSGFLNLSHRGESRSSA